MAAGHGSRPLRGLESTSQSSVQTAVRPHVPLAGAGDRPEGRPEEAGARAMLTGLAGLMVTSEFEGNAQPQVPERHGMRPSSAPEAPTRRARGRRHLSRPVRRPRHHLRSGLVAATAETDRTRWKTSAPRLDPRCLYGAPGRPAPTCTTALRGAASSSSGRTAVSPAWTGRPAAHGRRRWR